MERAVGAKTLAALKCEILAEGVNGPATPHANAVPEMRDEVFAPPGVLFHPGGAAASCLEWVQGLQQVFRGEAKVLDRALERSFQQPLQRPRRRRISRRAATSAGGVETVGRCKIMGKLFS